MLFRRQLPVASPLTASNIAGAISDVVARRDRSDQVRASLARIFDTDDVVLTDSGTSALVLALRAVASHGAVVAMPAYACVDLISAARRAGVRIRLFDVDPLTLSPDIDSLRRVLAERVSAVVVAHLYGFPADMEAVAEAAAEAGIPVIEDAAQHACATINGRAAGTFGDLTVLSFGRGKGTTSGRGGALLRPRNSTWPAAPNFPELATASGAKDLAIAAASWALGRPSIYGLPASIPALHLGETVYHEAGEPRHMSRIATALLHRTLHGMLTAAAARRAHALVLRDAADQSRDVMAVRPIERGESGYLRFPVLLRGEVRDAPALGIVRGYPRALSLEPEIRPCLVTSDEPLHGANELGLRLVTLPTHHLITKSDLAPMGRWLQHR